MTWTGCDDIGVITPWSSPRPWTRCGCRPWPSRSGPTTACSRRTSSSGTTSRIRSPIATRAALLPGEDVPRNTAWEQLRTSLAGRACVTALEDLQLESDRLLPLAHVGAWLHADVPGSVVPFWVTRTYPEVTDLALNLRGSTCTRPDCAWCEQRRDPRTLLRRWWGFEDFRAEPALPDGGSLQRAPVESGLREEPLFGVLPADRPRQEPAMGSRARTRRQAEPRPRRAAAVSCWRREFRVPVARDQMA